ncbi:peroxidase [Gordonia sp. SID5947]|uniref:peroxidase family protein n=1 Tax=Gordonia sp. SID5947 TaxID=2690315 RepID=UPI001371007E|nr:peroxidase family protein [Gordonia sp. SID5947]MYR05575.1 peroxidase [Gordonia sp. SID5947]
MTASTGGDRETDRRRSITRNLARAAEVVDRRVGWPALWRPVGLAVLVGLRSQLRALNLYDSGRDPDEPTPPWEPRALRARLSAGTHNDLDHPLMGAAASRFGRNVPPASGSPDPARLLEPNPRVVSQRLLKRDVFKPVDSLNLLAAAWIQFEVHDWFSHPDDEEAARQEIPLPTGDDWPEDRRPMSVHRSSVAPGADPDAPTFANRDTHWWDGSQIYGSAQDYADAIRSGDRGQITLAEDGLPPAEADRLLDPSGPVANFWVGLALLHSLFLREHNVICRRLAAAYPSMTDQQLYDTARLVNTALMAKIHTIDWTPAIISHPTTVAAMRGNWFGLLGERFARRFGRVADSEVLCGIPGSTTNHHGVPYSLTEEFVAVYRMHSLLPDEVKIRDIDGNRPPAVHGLEKLLADHVRDRLDETSMPDLFYSFGRAKAGELTLHNYPAALQQLARPDGCPVDLATIDILRDRERGVPRYNDFRRQFRLPRVASFAALTDNAEWAEQLEDIYGDIDNLDLMIGLHAERKPPGFGFSDTAFRVFVLMASRRLSSDRFFTTDFRPEIYTELGMAWVRDNSMRSVLLRHFPTLAPALAGVDNPFAPWPGR